MGYKDSWLWQRAFGLAREDATKDQQQYFQGRYLSMREKAVALVGRIQTGMTVHDESHLDALWEMGSIVARDSIELNPPEAFAFGGAVLLHDAAMTVAAYPNGVEGLKQTLAWRDSFARNLKATEASEEPAEASLIERLATAEALRIMHASQAEKLPTMSWSSPKGDSEYLIDDAEIRNFYGPKIGQLAHSHWWPIGRVEDEFVNDLGPLGGRTGNRIDLVKIACLLRVADAMHIDRRRAPAFLRKLLNPQGISAQHWTFQERMAVPFIENEALVYTAAPAFELVSAEAWWLANDALALIDRELRGVDHLLQKRGTGRLNANRVKGVENPSALARLVETVGWVPVDSSVRVSDVPKIVSTLGGSKLYGNNPTAPLRELLQNASDAVVVRRRLQDREDIWGAVTVSLDEIDGSHWLTVEDTGIGMSPNVLTGPLIDFGNSFWQSPLAAEEFPGIQASGVATRGKYGIGFFSVFMLGRRVRVTSRRYDKSADSARTLEFQHGLASRPVLYNADSADRPVDGGTRVSVCLDIAPSDEGGLLHQGRYIKSAIPLRFLVASLAPNLDVELLVKEGSSKGAAVRPKDWLSLHESRLIARLSASDPKEEKIAHKSRLRLLSADDGDIYGRAAIETSRFGSGRSGCITVGGLFAKGIPFIRGVLLGREVTAARDDALALVPPQVLASWATEQATLITKEPMGGEAKARGAQVVLACRGLIGDLPIAQWDAEWISSAEFTALLADIDKIVVYEGEVEYDSDLDEVHPKDFEHSFEEAQLVLFVPNQFPGYAGKFAEAFEVPPSADGPNKLLDLVLSLIEQSWANVEQTEVKAVVGAVDGTNIVRSALEFERIHQDAENLQTF